MKVRVQWMEHRRMEAVVEVESSTELEENWEMQYGSGLVDQIEDDGVEVDGGIDWDSMTWEEVK